MGNLEFKECSLKDVAMFQNLAKTCCQCSVLQKLKEKFFTKGKVQIFKDKIAVIEGKKRRMDCL
jgi:hypothetical protein